MPTVSKSPDAAALQITRNERAWNTTIGEDIGPITYGFRTEAPEYNNTHQIQSTFSPFTASQIASATLALNLWSDIANIEFVRVEASAGAQEEAAILFSNYYSSSDGAAAFAYYPSPGQTESDHPHGDVWVNRYYDQSQWTSDSYRFMTLLHEIGHAMGLEHPGEYNAAPNIVISYENAAEYIEDSRQYTVMSYFSAENTGADHAWYFAETPLMHDIVAMQRLYGANLTTRVENTVYGFDSNADRQSFHIENRSDPAIFCIWDAGGIDTLNLSGFTENQTIDLRPGAFSNAGALTKNISIAPGVIIENAIGGTGSDTLCGNEADNVLKGQDGNDVMHGRGGADLLVGAAGNDRVQGNEGSDFVFGCGGTDQLYGNNGDDTLDGGGGNDRLYGDKGADILVGGGGTDRLYGGVGADIFDFNTIKESPKGSAKGDVIGDFNHSSRDEIDFVDIDASSKKSGNQPFKYIGKHDFNDKAGELHYVKKKGYVIVEGDINGDGKADFQIKLEGISKLVADDFIL